MITLTALDQQIASILLANPRSKDGSIHGLIALLRDKEQTIANLEEHNKTLRDCLATHNSN